MRRYLILSLLFHFVIGFVLLSQSTPEPKTIILNMSNISTVSSKNIQEILEKSESFPALSKINKPFSSANHQKMNLNMRPNSIQNIPRKSKLQKESNKTLSKIQKLKEAINKDNFIKKDISLKSIDKEENDRTKKMPSIEEEFHFEFTSSNIDSLEQNESYISQEDISLIHDGFQLCWAKPNLPDIEKFNVSIKLKIAKDGTVISSETIRNQKFIGNEDYKLFVNSAESAIYNTECNPMPFRPSNNKYYGDNGWNNIEIIFNG